MSLLPVGVEAQLGSPWFPVAPPHPVVWLQNLAGYPENQKNQKKTAESITGKQMFLLEHLQD